MLKVLILACLTSVVFASCFAQAVDPKKPKSTTRTATPTATDTGQHFYVSPSGNPEGDGSQNAPWDLQTALRQPSTVHAGDTIWLRAGTYVGTFASVLTGTPDSPIKLRQYPGERATLDGNASTTLSAALDASTTSYSLAAGLFAPNTVVRIDSEDVLLFIKTGTNTYQGDRGWNGTTPVPHSAGAAVTTKAVALDIQGANAWYMGFEIMNSSGVRSNSVGGSVPPDRLGFAVNTNGPGTKIINMVIHDAGQGIGLWTPAVDAEAYGNLVSYNGWDAPDRGHGHGIYTQNQAPSVRRIVDNILFDQFAIGSQAYTEADHIDNVYLEGNTAFRNGILSQVSGYTYNLLIGGKPVAASPSMISNFTYSAPADGADNNLGYSGGCSNATVSDNYLAGGIALKLVNCTSGLRMSGNTLYGSTNGFNQFQFSGNEYLSSRPTGAKVFVRPNQYEAGRANITVYNWDNLDTVNVDLSGILSVGNGYEVRNVQDFFGAPVLSGIYTGGIVSLPMTGLSVSSPIGRPAPPPTGPEFNAFVVLTTTSARGGPLPVPRATIPTRTLER